MNDNATDRGGQDLPRSGPCPGPGCLRAWLDWLKQEQGGTQPARQDPPGEFQQGCLWNSVPYQEDSPVIRSVAELEGALEHLEYAVHRRFEHTLTRVERARLDNSITGAMYKIERCLERLPAGERAPHEIRFHAIRDQVRDARQRLAQQIQRARRGETRLAQLASLTPEQFEEFVGELLEAHGYAVQCTGGTGDEGVDLVARREGLSVVVQCKYLGTGAVVGAPEVRRFLGTIHHVHAHRGIFVTTRTFSLAAERFAADHAIELIDGPRLAELVEAALGVEGKRATAWF
jgi:restriction system protein